MAKVSSSTGWKIVAAFVAGALFGAFIVAQVAPNVTKQIAIEQPGSGPSGGPGGPGPTGSGLGPTPGQTGTNPLDPSGSNLACAPGRNGGRTDTGVTATQITLATTVVRSGIGAAFLGDVQFAMEAVKNKINRSGGVCGRQLSIRYVDDGWRSDLGAQDLRSFIKAGVFAIPVGPSSEGLNTVINNGDIRTAGIPVVGTDGMIISQYRDPWVWPVAVSTASSARIMVLNAYNRLKEQHVDNPKFAIVFDRNYKFGAEAAKAMNNEVRRLTHQDIAGFAGNSGNNCVKAYCGIDAGQPGYRNEVNNVASQDFQFLGMFLEPRTALTWMNTPGAPTIANSVGKAGMIGLAQPLFTRDFAVSCQGNCHKMWVWTGYKPPIEDYARDPIVHTFVNDLRKTKPDADESNAFAEGGYVGMLLLVKALQQVGPNLTRARLKAALNTMTFASGLTIQPTLRWPVGNYFAAGTMQAFEIQYSGNFGGWRTQDIVQDPRPQLGTG